MKGIRILLRDNPFQVSVLGGGGGGAETWLDSSAVDSEVSVLGYTLVRIDRKIR